MTSTRPISPSASYGIEGVERPQRRLLRHRPAVDKIDTTAKRDRFRAPVPAPVSPMVARHAAASLFSFPAEVA